MNPFNMTDRGRIVGARVIAEMLAKVLADQLKRPVEDQTWITMPFDFTLEWMPDSIADQSETVAANSAFLDGHRYRHSIYALVMFKNSIRQDLKEIRVCSMVLCPACYRVWIRFHFLSSLLPAG
jgi:hypothetical protein